MEQGSPLINHGAARYFAGRIRSLRLERGWSQEALVARLSEVGCYLPQSAISRLEQSNGRSVSVDEAFGFARAFELELDDLLLPERFQDEVQLHRDLRSGPGVLEQLRAAQLVYTEIEARLVSAMASNPGWRSYVFDRAEQAAEVLRQADIGQAMPTAEIDFYRAIVEAHDRTSS